MSSTQEYITEFKKAIARQGSAELLEWMKTTDRRAQSFTVLTKVVCANTALMYIKL